MQASQGRQESMPAGNVSPPWSATRKSLERLRHRSQNNHHLRHSSVEWSAARSVWEDADGGYLGGRSLSPGSARISCSSETAAAPAPAFQTPVTSGERSMVLMPEKRRHASLSSALLSPASSFSCTAPSVLAAAERSHAIVAGTQCTSTVFATPEQSSFILSRPSKKATPAEQIAGGARNISLTSLRPLSTNNLTNSMRKMRECQKFVKPRENRNPSILDATSAVSKSLPALYEDVDSFGTSIYGGDKGMSRREVGCNKSRYPSLSSVISSDDDDFYSHDSYDSSDTEEMSSPEPERRSRSFVCGMSRDHLENKLAAWKEARTKRLVNKMRKVEAAIAEWERKKTMKARMEMKDYEMKLENRRSKAMKKMEKKIWNVERAAQKKKQKEHVATTRRMTRVKTVAVDRGGGGGGGGARKLPWMLIFCS